MMARFPAPMAGWSVHRADRGRLPSSRRWRAAMPDRVPAGHHGLLGGAVVFFGVHPKTGRRFVVQSIEGGGWGGRPLRGRRVGTVSVCQGDVRNGSIEGIELKCPVVVEKRELRTDSGGPASSAAASASTCRCATWSRAAGTSNMPRRGKCPPWGLVGRQAGRAGGYLLRLPGENDFKTDGGAATFRCRSARRRSCAPAVAAAGAIRSTAIPNWCVKMSSKSSYRRTPRAPTMAWCSPPTARSTRQRRPANERL